MSSSARKPPTPAGYPCALRCGAVLRKPEDGVAFQLRSLRFATCHACAPRVTSAAQFVGAAAREGAKRLGLSLVQQHAPGLLPAAKALFGVGGIDGGLDGR